MHFWICRWSSEAFRANFTADPQVAAEHYATNDCETQSVLRRNCRASANCVKHTPRTLVVGQMAWTEERKTSAKLASLSQSKRRQASASIVKQCCVKVAVPVQSLLQLLVVLGKKNGRIRTTAVLHTTYRFTMRLVSAHISQWDVNLVEKSGNLRSIVTRSSGPISQNWWQREHQDSQWREHQDTQRQDHQWQYPQWRDHKW